MERTFFRKPEESDYLSPITLGLLPMALDVPEYSVIWGSMAMTFVTGLCTATFLTIIIIPLLWDIVATISDR